MFTEYLFGDSCFNETQRQFGTSSRVNFSSHVEHCCSFKQFVKKYIGTHNFFLV